MGYRNARPAAEIPLARLGGRRWGVAMCEGEWARFSNNICPAARLRILAVLEHFCDHGEADLPRGAFRWLSKSDVEGAARQGAFEARGVVLHGRAAMVGDRATFFVTKIDEDPPEAPKAPRRRRTDPIDQRQTRLPLVFSQRGIEHGPSESS